MGMYTELVIKARLEEDLPSDVESVLQFLFNGKDKPKTVPQHPFFACERWSFIGQHSSYYHHPESLSSYTERYLFSRSDLKNYDGEIAKFVDWIRPYLDALPGQCIGWSWYEEADVPTLLLMS